MKIDLDELEDLFWFIAKWIVVFSAVAGCVYYTIFEMIK